MLQSKYQYQFNGNAWAGIVDDNLIKPIFPDQMLAGERYVNYQKTDYLTHLTMFHLIMFVMCGFCMAVHHQNAVEQSDRF